MTKETQELTNADTTEPAAKSAPAAAKPATKKAKAAKAQPKKKVAAPAKKAAPAKAAEATKPFANESVIHVLKTEHSLRGLRAEALDCLRDGMTVEAYKKALAKREAAGSNRLSTYVGWALRTAISNKMVTVK